MPSGTNTNTNSDRICGPCRFGFQQEGDVCVDIELQNLSQEPLAPGNAGEIAAKLAAIVTNRQQNDAGVASVLSFASNIDVVCFLFSDFIILKADQSWIP